MIGLWQVLRVYDVGDKLLNAIKSEYLNSLAYVRAKGCESECFRIDSSVRQVGIMSPWLFIVYMKAVRKELKWGLEKGSEISRGGERVEIDWPLVCIGESEKDLRAKWDVLLRCVGNVVTWGGEVRM